MKASEANQQDTKWIFVKKGPCSSALFHILNMEFGYPKANEEKAAEHLAGGILQHGYQCGILFGAVLSVGAESYRRCSDKSKAVSLTINTTKHLIESFIKRAKSVDCEDITKCHFKENHGLTKFMISGKFISCFKLADKWAPEAIKYAHEGLSESEAELLRHQMSCASEVVKKMGATEEEMAIVAGFAGGLGLSGNACGALSAAIWMNSLKEQRESNKSEKRAKETLEAFFEAADYEFLCSEITGQHFNTIEDHTEFIKTGGCSKLIEALAEA